MENNAIKLKYNISPKAYAYFLFAKDTENRRVDLREEFQRLLNQEIEWKNRPYTPFFYINSENVVFLLNSERAPYQDDCKNYIKICDLPLSFFDDVEKEFGCPFALRTHYASKVDVLIGEYFKFVVKNLLQQIPLGALNFPLDGAVSLNLQAITYKEFKNTRYYKREEREFAFGEFCKVVRRMFRPQDFYLDISVEREITQIILWDYRHKEAIAYDVLSYTSDSFVFLEGKDKRLKKLFFRRYFEHLLQVNLKQILKGAGK